MAGSRIPIISVFVSLCIFLSNPLKGAPGEPRRGALSPDLLLREGDASYQRQEYRTALLYYRQAFKERPGGDSASRLLLGHLKVDARMEESGLIRSALALDQEGPFSYHYISLFASYRLGQPDLADLHEAHLAQKARASLTPVEQRWFLLLQGSRLIQEERWDEAVRHFSDLANSPGEPGEVARKITGALQQRDQLPRKSPWTAAALSAALPGAGQFYSRHYSDGVMAFFWNTTFLGGGAYAYNLESASHRPHSVSILALLVGLLFYSSNIAGAYASANRFNVYQERRFYQDVRDTYFNVDFIERTSGLEFSRPLQF